MEKNFYFVSYTVHDLWVPLNSPNKWTPCQAVIDRHPFEFIMDFSTPPLRDAILVNWFVISEEEYILMGNLLKNPVNKLHVYAPTLLETLEHFVKLLKQHGPPSMEELIKRANLIIHLAKGE